MDKKLLLIGGGGHCKSVIEAAESSGSYSELGIIDVEENIGKKLLHYWIIGSDNDIERFKEEGFTHAFVSLGSIGNPSRRLALFQVLKQIGYTIPVISDCSANVSRFATIADGVFVGKNVIVNADCKIGTGAILNSGTIIEHDCKIGNFAHIAPGAVLCGNVTIGDNSHIGAGCVVRQDIAIGRSSVIGIGSVVVKDIGDNCQAYGNPCQEVKHK